MAPETATERAAIVAIELSKGRKLSTREIATMAGLSRYGAYRLTARLSRVLPLVLYMGEWQLVSVVDTPSTETGYPFPKEESR